MIYFTNFNEKPILIDNTDSKEVEKYIDVQFDEAAILKNFKQDLYYRVGFIPKQSHQLDRELIDILKTYGHVDYFIFDDRGEADDIETIEYCARFFKKNKKKFLAITAGLTDFYHPNHTPHNNFMRVGKKEHRYAVNTCTHRIRNRNKLYCSLNRLIDHRHERISLVHSLYKANLLKDGLVSLGTGHSSSYVKKYIEDHGYILEKEFLSILPIKVDSLTINSETPYWDNKTSDSYPVKDALFGIVTESASTKEVQSKKYPLVQYGGGGWSRIFLTEKTVKTFYNYQIPIFLTLPGYVEFLRKYNFDLFDDIVDHSYDNLIHIDDRIDFIVKEIKRLKNTNILEKTKVNAKLSNSLEKRMKNNIKVLETMSNKFGYLYLNRLISFLYDK